MKIDEAIELMKNEKACILKAYTCDKDCAKCELAKKTEDLLSAYDMVIKALEQTKHAHWTEKYVGGMFLQTCSNCNAHAIIKSNYCPNCGARMDEDERTLKYADQDTMMSAT